MIAKQLGQSSEVLLAEIERLKNVVKSQEEELAGARKAIEKLEADQKLYQRALLSELKKGYSEEQLRRWAEEEDTDGIPLSDFIGDLERMVHEQPQQ
jgi:hypothetical protein